MGFSFNFYQSTQEQREVVFWALWELSGSKDLWSDLGAESERDFIENTPSKKQIEAVKRFEQLVKEQPINNIQELVFQNILFRVEGAWRGVVNFREGNTLNEEDLNKLCEEIQQEIAVFENAFPDIDFTPIQEKLEAHFKITPEILAERKDELDAFFKPILESMRKSGRRVLRFDPSKRKPK